MSYQEQTTTDQTVTDTRDERLATHPVGVTLAQQPDLSRFSEMLRQTGMDRSIQDGEWITVFAPNNQALDGAGPLPQGEELHRLVRHHISQGAKTADDVRRVRSVRMKDGSEVPVRMDGADVRVGDARLVRADIQCVNGVIQVIDGVLRP